MKQTDTNLKHADTDPQLKLNERIIESLELSEDAEIYIEEGNEGFLKYQVTDKAPVVVAAGEVEIDEIDNHTIETKQNL